MTFRLRPLPRVSALLALPLLFVLAGCGDDDDRSTSPDLGATADASMADAGRDGAVTADAFVETDAFVEVDLGRDAGPADAFVPTDASPPDGFECADRTITLDEVIVDTTVGGADVRNSDGDDCLAAFASGPERVYLFTAPVAATYRVTVTPTDDGFDPMLYLQPACDDTSMCLAVAGLNGPGGTDSTTVDLAADQAVLITVDTDLRSLGDTEGGPFELVVATE
tara:strand:+ start:599 stop:1270 length:672 start_codon:yes stop_codon:yes gene_type:complete